MLAALAFVPVLGYLEAVGVPALAVRLRRTPARAVRRPALARAGLALRKKLILDRDRRADAVDARGRARAPDRAPTLALLAEHGRYRRAVSTFPSLTPVCLSSLATGAHPDVHEIPHLVWYHRGERRLVEYGSSFGAVRAAGHGRSLRDTIFELNASHLGRERRDGVRGARGGRARRPRRSTSPATAAARRTGRPCPFLPGPRTGRSRFFFYNLFESDVTGAPLAVRNRPRGTIDAYAAAVGRWLVTRDGFDFLVYYLSDYDFASHVQGPDAAHEALARSDAAVGALVEAAGGLDEFLERYALVLCADHGQTQVSEVARLEDVVPATCS